MGKVIGIDRNAKNRSSFLSALIRGTPYRFNMFGKTVTIIGTFYKLSKQNEFFDEYWHTFRNGLSDIIPNQEFNTNYIVNRLNSLPESEKMGLFYKLSEIYAYNDKVTYADLCDTVNACYSALGSDLEPEMPGNGAA